MKYTNGKAPIDKMYHWFYIVAS